MTISIAQGVSAIDPLRLGKGIVLATATKTAAYTMVNTDYTIRADATAGPFTVTLPATPAIGQMAAVKKVDASVNMVTVSGNGRTIDGLTEGPLGSQYDTIRAQFNGTTWDLL